MNSLKATVVPQMERAKVKAQKLEKLGRISHLDLFLFLRKADQMIEFITEMQEVEVNYGEAVGDQTGE